MVEIAFRRLEGLLIDEGWSALTRVSINVRVRYANWTVGTEIHTRKVFWSFCPVGNCIINVQFTDSIECENFI